jgi:hypothetical protein
MNSILATRSWRPFRAGYWLLATSSIRNKDNEQHSGYAQLASVPGWLLATGYFFHQEQRQ